MSHPYTGQKKVKEIIYRLLEPTLEKQGWYLSKLIMNWELIVGSELKDHIRPTRFLNNIKNRETGILYVRVSHLGMQHVQFNKGFLIEKFNLYLGCKAILDIKPHLWPSSQSIPHKGKQLGSNISFSPSLIGTIQDPSLKTALQDLWIVLSR